MLPWGAWGQGVREGIRGKGGSFPGWGEEVPGSQAVGWAGSTQPGLGASALSSHMPLSICPHHILEPPSLAGVTGRLWERQRVAPSARCGKPCRLQISF